MTIIPDQSWKNRFVPVYMDQYDNGMRVIQHIGGKLSIYPILVDADLKEKGLDRKKALLLTLPQWRKVPLSDK